MMIVPPSLTTPMIPSRGLKLWDTYLPTELSQDPEILRRSRLQLRFGWMGALFGLAYASFYMLADHLWGAAIIIICSMCFAMIPVILRRGRNLRLTGHLFALILFCGFTGLCAIEGGLYGHAIAWLASIPLCVLLLLEIKDALIWSGLCFLAAGAFGLLGVFGIEVVHTYDMSWEPYISFAGYCGLICFMTLLGCIFELTRKRAFQQMQLALDQLSTANQRLLKLHHEKDEFLNIAAHDLKNPLCGISGYAELLGYYTNPTPEKIAETSTVIQKQCKRMLEIISNLLDVQRIEEGSIKMKIVGCPVEPVLTKMIATYQLRAQNKNIRLLLEGDTARTCVMADENAMDQILDNLISNAIKYSPQGTVVRCVCTTSKDSVAIQICDEGPGLSEADQANLFKKFSKLTPRPTGGESSNGLGLWIVHRMAQGMNGSVECHSQLGKGTTFTLSLPLGAPEDLQPKIFRSLTRPLASPPLPQAPPWKLAGSQTPV
ncbi:signal transduction histidine kinase [Prosthecobacter fusiformis]|uniref:histidine kinase n=1 Tax=Prosthecobacter fusiformis TaxID=48464 RepID=A0A4R7S5D6_9BACT|nr:HAMP domain-containing sensor histidine kinase [Prosthecobacter fusiformis]TDU72856.1 signal transduction histidine kinase [Prosthecobacter fusiformis]